MLGLLGNGTLGMGPPADGPLRAVYDSKLPFGKDLHFIRSLA